MISSLWSSNQTFIHLFSFFRFPQNILLYCLIKSMITVTKCLLRLLPLAANFRQNIGHSMSQSIFKKWKIRCLQTSFLFDSQSDRFCCWTGMEWVHISLVCVAALDCWHAHVTLGCRKWLEHTRGIEPAAPAWLTETRVTTKWSEDEREPSFTLGRTQYLNSHTPYLSELDFYNSPEFETSSLMNWFFSLFQNWILQATAGRKIQFI